MTEYRHRFDSKWTPEPYSGCWLWFGGRTNFGHGTFRLPGRIRESAHRVSWMLNVGDIPKGMSVLHKCDVPSCVNPDHLFIGTQADNIADMTKKGRGRKTFMKGHAPLNAKLTIEQVKEIRSRTESRKLLSVKFGVSINTINSVLYGSNWRNIAP